MGEYEFLMDDVILAKQVQCNGYPGETARAANGVCRRLSGTQQLGIHVVHVG